MYAYEGYFENGLFHMSGRTIRIPERQKAIIVLNEEIPETETRSQKQLAAFRRFIEANRAIVDEPIDEEFDEILASGITIRELDS